ncbi:TauD/TfdA family dioxygenase [Streptomyces sp. P9(2023)]|uniref:TauD/TfdA dioxygenase family protein n=1 Tax=Streptomyces sp. P9(2023) TaxID=3064394 RepID=UPI0028F4006E|nr:TauD/TfdA family dioxygenase [Streptomyces sp. P9(2023)]MDT9692488.1 TauD/TfdA family dioxygenase [Streptomyces sp. P9(2023)]
MEIKELTPFIGSEVAGATYEDLQRPEVFEQLIDIVHRRELLVVRGLELTPEQQIELATRVGRPVPFLMATYRHPEHEEIMISSNAMKANRPVGIARVGNFWHQDSSYMKDPAPYTMLHGVDVPSTSGHTLYASALDVYDRLPQEWKEKIAGRTALHTVSKRQRISPEHAGLSIAEFKALVEQQYPPTEHPLVREDRYTGRPYLYGAPEYMDSVVGFDANENAEFFAVVDGLIQDPEHVYTHRWTTNDLVVWKTATTYHAATEVEPGATRTVHRVSIEEGEQWAA